ncbi:MAG: hypothetical protein LBL18_01805, partial [Bacteroidales bacterium]|jgi:hypothetical protein|nr:hypothetical protein [Bacteroidales bacterium]
VVVVGTALLSIVRCRFVIPILPTFATLFLASGWFWFRDSDAFSLKKIKPEKLTLLELSRQPAKAIAAGERLNLVGF